MTLRCPECGERSPSLHPTGQSLAMHMWKSQDSAHAEWDEYEATLSHVYQNLDEYELGDLADANRDERSAPDSATTVGEPSETVPDDGVETVTDGSGGLPEPTHLCDNCGSQLIRLAEFLQDLEDDLDSEQVDQERWEEIRGEMLEQYERACPTCSGDGEVVAV